MAQFGAVSFAFALTWASWTWVESPALRLKAWTRQGKNVRSAS